jgi:hypothetical protein
MAQALRPAKHGKADRLVPGFFAHPFPLWEILWVKGKKRKTQSSLTPKLAVPKVHYFPSSPY